MATCWSRRPPRRRPSPAIEDHSIKGYLLPPVPARRRLGRAERQPHHPAARRGRRRRRRDPHALYHRPDLALRHGPGRIDTLYVANADALLAFPYDPARDQHHRARRARSRGSPPSRNHHWTKSLAAGPDGSRLYVGVGSNSNVAEHGMDEEEERAAIWAIDPAHRQPPPVRHRPAQPGRHRPSSRARTISTSSSTSATSWAATSSPIT